MNTLQNKAVIHHVGQSQQLGEVQMATGLVGRDHPFNYRNGHTRGRSGLHIVKPLVNRIPDSLEMFGGKPSVGRKRCLNGFRESTHFASLGDGAVNSPFQAGRKHHHVITAFRFRLAQTMLAGFIRCQEIVKHATDSLNEAWEVFFVHVPTLMVPPRRKRKVSPMSHESKANYITPPRCWQPAMTCSPERAQHPGQGPRRD